MHIIMYTCMHPHAHAHTHFYEIISLNQADIFV